MVSPELFRRSADRDAILFLKALVLAAGGRLEVGEVDFQRAEGVGINIDTSLEGTTTLTIHEPTSPDRSDPTTAGL